MRAIVQDHYGTPDALALADIPVPDLSPDGVLVKVQAASIDAGVHHLMTADLLPVRLAYGLRRPRRRPGIAFAGTVLEVGSGVTDLRVGQSVFGTGSGAFAEVVAARATKVAALPDGVDAIGASTVPVSGVTALQAVRDHGRVVAGQRVLITGASGGVGAFAVQLACAAGAEVTGVCSGSKVDLVRDLGAQHTIDYGTEPIQGRFDVVLDIAGPLPFGRTRRLLAPGGTLVIIGASAYRGPTGGLERNLRASLLSPFVPETLSWFVQKENHGDLVVMATALGDGSVRPLVDRVYPLAEAADAMRRYESGEIRGKVVVTP